MAVVLGGGAVVNVFFRSAQTKSSRLPLQTRPGNPSRGAFWANNMVQKLLTFCYCLTCGCSESLLGSYSKVGEPKLGHWLFHQHHNHRFFLSQSHSKYILQPGCRWHEQVRPDWLYGMCGILLTYFGFVICDVFGIYGTLLTFLIEDVNMPQVTCWTWRVLLWKMIHCIDRFQIVKVIKEIRMAKRFKIQPRAMLDSQLWKWKWWKRLKWSKGSKTNPLLDSKLESGLGPDLADPELSEPDPAVFSSVSFFCQKCE